ncbi:hypothetical protein OEZ79_27295, partial [Leclercia adecarboxylata]
TGTDPISQTGTAFDVVIAVNLDLHKSSLLPLMSTALSGGLLIAMPPFCLLSNGQDVAEVVFATSSFRFAIRNLAGSLPLST